jgi:SAM-dependent methyltransferase
VTLLFDAVDFLKCASEQDFYSFGLAHTPVPYRRCSKCGFIFTNFFDEWSAEDFAAAIYNDDYRLVDGDYSTARPSRCAEKIAHMFEGHENLEILDFGSGSNIFSRRLASFGFSHVESYDPFSSPSKPTALFDIITCFEVLEHAPQPPATVSEMLSYLKDDGCIIFSTAIQPNNIEQIRGGWWYIAPRNGHVSIYSAESLAVLARRLGAIYRRGASWHVFHRSALSGPADDAARMIGPPYLAMFLGAPSAIDDGDLRQQWHDSETSRLGRFRWTASSKALLEPPCFEAYPGAVKWVVRFANQITPGFAERCTLEIGERLYPMQASLSSVAAECVVAAALEGPIRLATPDPISPAAFRGASDTRKLGLAVMIETS